MGDLIQRLTTEGEREDQGRDTWRRLDEIIRLPWQLQPFGVCDGDGLLVYIGLHADEQDCWRIYLGWPTIGEIDDAKARGLRCARLSVKMAVGLLEPSGGADNKRRTTDVA